MKYLLIVLGLVIFNILFLLGWKRFFDMLDKETFHEPIRCDHAGTGWMGNVHNVVQETKMSDITEILQRVQAFKHFRDLNPDKSYASPEAQDAILLAEEVERLRGDLAEAKIETANLNTRLRHRDEQIDHLYQKLNQTRGLVKESLIRAEQDLMAVGHSHESEPLYIAMHDLSTWIARLTTFLAKEDKR